MSSWTALDLALLWCRTRFDVASLLEFALPTVFKSRAMYTQRLPARWPMGTRGGSRGHAKPIGSGSRCDAHSTTNGGASIWNDQVMDGCCALPYKDAAKRADRDELARPCLQPQTDDADSWPNGTNAGDSGVVPRSLQGPLPGFWLATFSKANHWTE